MFSVNRRTRTRSSWLRCRHLRLVVLWRQKKKLSLNVDSITCVSHRPVEFWFCWWCMASVQGDRRWDGKVGGEGYWWLAQSLQHPGYTRLVGSSCLWSYAHWVGKSFVHMLLHFHTSDISMTVECRKEQYVEGIHGYYLHNCIRLLLSKSGARLSFWDTVVMSWHYNFVVCMLEESISVNNYL